MTWFLLRGKLYDAIHPLFPPLKGLNSSKSRVTWRYPTLFSSLISPSYEFHFVMRGVTGYCPTPSLSFAYISSFLRFGRISGANNTPLNQLEYASLTPVFTFRKYHFPGFLVNHFLGFSFELLCPLWPPPPRSNVQLIHNTMILLIFVMTSNSSVILDAVYFTSSAYKSSPLIFTSPLSVLSSSLVTVS